MSDPLLGPGEHSPKARRNKWSASGAGRAEDQPGPSETPNLPVPAGTTPPVEKARPTPVLVLTGSVLSEPTKEAILGSLRNGIPPHLACETAGCMHLDFLATMEADPLFKVKATEAQAVANDAVVTNVYEMAMQPGAIGPASIYLRHVQAEKLAAQTREIEKIRLTNETKIANAVSASSAVGARDQNLRVLSNDEFMIFSDLHDRMCRGDTLAPHEFIIYGQLLQKTLVSASSAGGAGPAEGRGGGGGAEKTMDQLFNVVDE